MAEMPRRIETTILRVEWIIGNDMEEFSLARTLTDGLFFIGKQLEEMGVKVSDDMYKWASNDGGSIRVWVDIPVKKKKEGEA